MDTDALNILVITLKVLSYIGTFMLGYGVRSYVSSHHRHSH